MPSSVSRGRTVSQTLADAQEAHSTRRGRREGSPASRRGIPRCTTYIERKRAERPHDEIARARTRRPSRDPVLGGERRVAVRRARRKSLDVAVASGARAGLGQPSHARRRPCTDSCTARSHEAARARGGRAGAASRDRGRRGGSSAPRRCCAAGPSSRRRGPSRGDDRPDLGARARASRARRRRARGSSRRVACSMREVLLRREARPRPHRRRDR